RTLSADEQVAWLKGLDRSQSWIEALKQQAIRAVVDTARDHAVRELGLTRAEAVDAEMGREEIAAAMRLDPRSTARTVMDYALRLTGRHTATLSALRAGRLSSWHARAGTDER